jgi:hypothetical protein
VLQSGNETARRAAEVRRGTEVPRRSQMQCHGAHVHTCGAAPNLLGEPRSGTEVPLRSHKRRFAARGMRCHTEVLAASR